MKYTREPFLVVFKEDSLIKETYAGQLGTVVLEGHHLVPEGGDRKTVVIFMHPIGSTQYLPMIGGLAKAGIPVISCNSRYPRNDSALIMEKVCADLGAAVRHAREKFGYERVVLGGWSGGGSLSLFFQSQAENPTITETPAGDPYDLTAAGLVPADAIMLLAAHTSRAKTLTEWMDPSIRDEQDPFDRDASLNIFDPKNPAQPPYEAEFLDRYRKAQVARNRRITEWAQSMLADARKRGDDIFEHCFVCYGTMADPREVAAWQDVLGVAPDAFPLLQATKSLIGHAMGAAGALEAIACLAQLRSGFFHGTTNLERLHPEVEHLEHAIPTASRDVELDTLASASFGFGDVNAAVVLGRWRDQ